MKKKKKKRNRKKSNNNNYWNRNYLGKNTNNNNIPKHIINEEVISYKTNEQTWTSDRVSARAHIHWTFIVDEWMQQQRGYYFIYQFCLWCCCVVIVGFILSRLHRPNSLAIDDRWSLRMECMHHKMLRNEKKKRTRNENSHVYVFSLFLFSCCSLCDSFFYFFSVCLCLNCLPNKSSFDKKNRKISFSFFCMNNDLYFHVNIK